MDIVGSDDALGILNQKSWRVDVFSHCLNLRWMESVFKCFPVVPRLSPRALYTILGCGCSHAPYPRFLDVLKC